MEVSLFCHTTPMFVKLAILLLALVATVQLVAAAKKPCTVPEQFTTRILQAQLTKKGKCSISSDAGELFYDAKNQRIRFDLSGVFGERPLNLTLIEDWKAHKQYVIYQDTNRCQQGILGSRFPSLGLSQTAQYLSTYLVGSQDIDAWLMRKPFNENIDVVMSVTGGSCFLTSLVAVNTTSRSVSVTETFFNFLPDLPPFIFNIPLECKGHHVRTPSEEDMELVQVVRQAYAVLSEKLY